MAQVLGLLADVHARVRGWKQEDKTGLYWSRATGSSAGLGDSGAVVFFQEAAGGEVILATTSTGKAIRPNSRHQTNNSELRNKHGNDIERWWQERFGHTFDGLTQSEARTSHAPRALTSSEIALLRQSKQEISQHLRKTA